MTCKGSDALTSTSHRTHCHPAGEITRVPEVPRKVTVKIRDAKNWWADAGIIRPVAGQESLPAIAFFLYEAF